MSKDREALMQDILDHPECDVRRGVLADWLEDHGQPERAEFVRVQLELAATADPDSDRFWDGQLGRGPTHYQRRKALRCRERELLGAVPLLVGLPGYPSLRVGSGLISRVPGPCDPPDFSARCYEVTFRRGFVAEISLGCEDFMKHAEGIFSRHPIEKVTLSDRWPIKIGNVWNWMRNEHIEKESPWFLPPAIWRYVDLPLTDVVDTAKCAGTDKHARAALAQACLAHGRSRRKRPERSV